MFLSISDFFKCPVTLNRLQNCGFLSSYLDPFAHWMDKQQFKVFTIRRHVTNVAHLSHSLNGLKPDIEQLNEHIQTFSFKHIPICKCSGKRTYAIVQILHTYGVRGCQLRALKLSDIDWHKDQIHFPAVKGGKSCCFPLTAQVGNALVDYLKNARKKCGYPQVFLTLRAPLTPLTKSRTLSQIIRSAMLKAGIKSPTKGAHCFRHGFVSRMLKQGESFKHIADLVGHKHIATTFIYTKIDFNSLAQVALELPEVRYETC